MYLDRRVLNMPDQNHWYMEPLFVIELKSHSITRYPLAGSYPPDYLPT